MMERYNFKHFKEFLIEKSFHHVYDSQLKTTIKMSDLIVTFDIETSNTYVGENKFAFMYIWQVGLLNNGEELYFYGRTWGEFKTFLKHLRLLLALNSKKKCYIWVHNLAFEFQFMRKELGELWSVFAGDIRKPYKAEIDFIIFRDTLILSGMSLEKVAENLINHKIEKLTGDLDYSLIRHQNTPLTSEEKQYCLHDVKILCYYIEEQKDIYGNLGKIPLTNTGRVRQFVKEKCLYTSKSHRKSNGSKYKNYRKLMSFLTLTERTYKLFNTAFQGGFTHANVSYVNQIIDNVHSIDFTSSYPTVMIAEKFPMSSPEQITINSLEEYKELRQNKDNGFLMVIQLENVVSKISFENYLSESKAIIKKNLAVNNGRIFSADLLVLCLTEIDLDLILQVYDFSKIHFLECYHYYMSYLPTAIIKSILELYGKKTTLKGVEGKEVEYLLSKAMLNSIYGMTVTAIVRDEQIYDNNMWTSERGNAEEEIKKYNESKNRFLFYPWGVYVTAYARRNLWKGILHFQDDYIYSDTDSIKFINLEKHKEWIKAYNKEISDKIKNALEFSVIEYTTPKTIKGIEKPLGVWDYEGKYNRFKTLGAKRYMYQIDGIIHITVAGLSKSQGAQYIARQKNPFEFFSNEMYIPSNHTSKLTHTYIDYEQTYDIMDYKGNVSNVTALSGVHLEPTDFTLSQSEQFSRFIDNFCKGYLAVGTSYDL